MKKAQKATRTVGKKPASKPPTKQKYIKTPEEMWRLFVAYKEEIKGAPRIDQVVSQGRIVNRQLVRPLTFVGFENYLWRSKVINDLGDYEKNKDGRYAAYAPILTRVKAEIEEDQFEGASMGVYNQAIIARKLGLVDKQNLEHTGKVEVITGMEIK